MEACTLSIPARLGLASVETLNRDLERALSLRSVGLIVLEGTAEAFCAGLDTGELLESGDELTRRAAIEGYQKTLRLLRLGGKPTIAVVAGPAHGGGVGLALACDYVLAAESASFALPEALFGLIPAMVMPLALERMRPQTARLWSMSCVSHSAAQALAAGVADEVVPASELGRAKKRVLRLLGRARPQAVAEIKQFTAVAKSLPLEEALVRGGELTLRSSGDPVVVRALQSFREYGSVDWGEEEHD